MHKDGYRLRAENITLILGEQQGMKVNPFSFSRGQIMPNRPARVDSLVLQDGVYQLSAT